MRKLGLSTLAAAFLLSSGTAWATNGHQLAAVGAYGASMGGAVTAAPFDTTTAVTNPAGLTKIGTRADFDFEVLMPKRSVDFTGTGGGKSTGGSEQYLIPSVGWSAPINDDQTLFFGGGMFVVSGMGVDYDTINAMPFLATAPAPLTSNNMFKGRIFSQYQFWKMAPTLAKKFSDKLSVGLALNIDYQQLSIKQKFTDGTNTLGVDLSTPSGAMGYGFTVGAIYDVNDMITIGLNYSSKQSFSKMQYRVMAGEINYNPAGSQYLYTSTDSTYSVQQDFPQQYAIGLAVRPTQNLTITADYKWINFSDTHKKLSIDGTFNTADLMAGMAAGTANQMVLDTGWKDVSIIAIGAQYQIGDKGWIRAGYNQGGSPIDGGNASNNWAFPAIAKTHYMFGGTANIGTHWQLHLAYESIAKETLTGTYGDKISLEGSSYTIGVSYLFH